MTDDLVKRLNMVDATMNPMTLVIVAREAANEIERLQMVLDAGGSRYWEARCLEMGAALLEIIDSARLVGDYHHVKIARAALGEKTND